MNKTVVTLWKYISFLNKQLRVEGLFLPTGPLHERLCGWSQDDRQQEVLMGLCTCPQARGRLLSWLSALPSTASGGGSQGQGSRKFEGGGSFDIFQDERNAYW